MITVIKNPTASSGSSGDVNLTGINGVTPSVGNGATNTGTLRVTVSNDSTGQLTVLQGGSWSVTANAGTNLNTSALALEATQTSGSAKTQITDSSGTANTMKALNVQVVGTDYGIVTHSVIHGLTTAGGGSYVDAKVTPSGALAVAATQDTSPWVISGTVTANAGTGTFAISAASLPLPTGAATEATLSTLNGKIPSNLTVTSTRLLVDGSGVTQPVSGTVSVSGSVAVTNAALSVVGGGLEASALRVTIASDSTGVLSVDDNGGSLTVDGTVAVSSVGGTVAATQSGTWTVQPGNTANTTAWLVTGTGGTFPVTDSGGSLTVDNAGTFAVQAAQSGTWNITNISGTVSLPTGAATESTLSTLNGKIPSNLTVTSTRLLVDGSGVTQPVSGTVSISGTVAATQSGTWTVQPGNTANTTPWLTSSKTALTGSSPTAATVGTSSASAVAANSSRKGLILSNTSNNTISFGLGATAVLNSGITLPPGGVWQMDEFSFTTAAINAIASAASSNLAIQEFT